MYTAQPASGLHRRAPRDPLIATMAFFHYRHVAEELDLPPPPPLVPMVMQLINIHAVGDALSEAAPNWHTHGCCNHVGDKTKDAVRNLHVMIHKRNLSSHLLVQHGSRITSLTVACPMKKIHAPSLSALPKLHTLTVAFDCVGETTWIPPLPSTLRRLSIGTDAVVEETTLQRCVSRLPFLTWLCLDGRVADLNALCAAPRLTYLKIVSSTLRGDGIRDLGKCSSLTELDLQRCEGVDHLSGLETSQSLIILRLHRSSATTQHPSLFAVCSTVPTLRNVSGVPLARAVEVVRATGRELRFSLSIWPDEILDSLDAMAKAVSRLELRRMTGPNWSNLHQLTELEWDFDDWKVDIDALAMLPSLAVVRLGSFDTSDLFGFWASDCHGVGSWRNSRSLRSLTVSDESCMVGIDEVPTLRELHCVPGTAFCSETLRGCSNLTELSLVGDAVTSTILRQVTSMASLEVLYLKDCLCLSDVSVIEALNLPSLTEVILSGTGVPDQDRAEQRINAALQRRHLHSSWYLSDAL